MKDSGFVITSNKEYFSLIKGTHGETIIFHEMANLFAIKGISHELIKSLTQINWYHNLDSRMKSLTQINWCHNLDSRMKSSEKLSTRRVMSSNFNEREASGETLH